MYEYDQKSSTKIKNDVYACLVYRELTLWIKISSHENLLSV